MCEEPGFQLQTISNVIIHSNSLAIGISCWTSIFNLSKSKLQSSMKKISSNLWDMTIHILFFSEDQYRLMAWWLSRLLCCTELGNVIDMSLISSSAGCWNSLQRLGHFAWHWASQWTDTQAFILLLSLSLFSWISSVVIWNSGCC